MTRLHVALFLTSVLVVGAVALATAPTPTKGLFTDSKANGANTFTTTTVLPPTGLSATPTGPTTVDLSWIASASAFASGYTILRSTTSGCCYSVVGSVVGHSTTVYSDSGLTASTTYYYVVQATYQNWTSVGSNEASATPS